MMDFISADIAFKVEEHTLSCLLWTPEAIEKAKVLPPQAFSEPAHELIFRAALRLHERGESTNLLSVTAYLNNAGNLRNVGGQPKLAELLDLKAPIEWLDTCIERLQQHYQQRVLRKIQENLSSPENIPDAIAQLQALQSNQAGKSALAEAAQKAREILQSNRDELTINIELEAVREACKMSSYDWERKIIKPLKRDLEADRFKLELLGLLQIDDQVERIRQQALLAPKYQMSTSLIEKAMSAMKQRTQTPESKALDLDELFDLESEGLTWVIPSLLPEKATVVLAGAPKSGKTLLAIDVAYAVATGESCFLGEVAKRGKVLFISTDESANSTKAKLLNRGFRRRDKDIKILPTWDISQMGVLESLLEDFRPSLVIIDSLRRINKGSEISENSTEFSDAIYTLKETLERYGASGILIHHTNKDREALGVHQLRGSSAIAGAVSATWQLDHIPKPDPNNKKKLIVDPKDPKRTLSIFARDIEGQSLTIELNPENSSWVKLGEVGESEEAEAERDSLRKRILNLLGIPAHATGLSGSEIVERLDAGDVDKRSIYNCLNRMVSKRIISSKPAPGDKRYTIYSLPNCHTGECLSLDCHTQKTSPPPPPLHLQCRMMTIALKGLLRIA